MREKTFHTATLGCRLNQAESGEIAEQLVKSGWRQTAKPGKAELIVVNTCVVTGKAEHETRKMIRGMRRKNQRAFLVVAGCWVDLIDSRTIKQLNNQNKKVLKLADLVVRNEEKRKAIEIIVKAAKKTPRQFLHPAKETPPGCCKISPWGWGNWQGVPCRGEGIGGVMSKYTQANRALVRIQSGCQQFCSYCLVPYVRGPMINRPAKEVVEKVKQLVKQGMKEIILTGVNLSYWQEGRLELPGLVKKILRNTKIERVRFGSVNLACFDNNFISLFKNPRVCRHVHLPIQSGSDKTLKKMKRPYQLVDVKRVVKRLRKIRGMSVTTDVMVGFPGETRKDFEESLKNIEMIGFGKLHVFAYSKRPGTLVAKMIGKKGWEEIDKKTKRARSQKMRALGRKMRIRFLESQIGKTLPVLFGESTKGGYWGLTDNYLPVEAWPCTRRGAGAVTKKNWQGKIRRMRIVDLRKMILQGRISA